MMDNELFMGEIENYNCDGLCIQEFCSEKYTHMIKHNLLGLKLVLGFCKKHGKEIEDKLWNKFETDKRMKKINLTEFRKLFLKKPVSQQNCSLLVSLTCTH